MTTKELVGQLLMNDKNQRNMQRTNSKTKKKAYVKPVLTPLGDIRDVTMGGSPGFGDSGGAGPEKPF